MYIRDDYDDEDGQGKSRVVRRGGKNKEGDGYYSNRDDDEDDGQGKKSKWFRRKKTKKGGEYAGREGDEDYDEGEGMHRTVNRKGRRKTLESGYYTEDSDDSRGGDLRRKVGRRKVNTNHDYHEFDNEEDPEDALYGQVRRGDRNREGGDDSYRYDEDEDGEELGYKVDPRGRRRVGDGAYRSDEESSSAHARAIKRKEPSFDLCCKCMGTTILELVVLTLVYFSTVVLLDLDWGWPQCFFLEEGWNTLPQTASVPPLSETPVYNSSKDIEGLNCDITQLKQRSNNWNEQVVCVDHTTYCNQRFVPASVDYLFISLFVWPLWFSNLILQTIQARRVYREHTKPGKERQKQIRDDRRLGAVEQVNKRNVDWERDLSKWKLAQRRNNNRRGTYTWRLSKQLRLFHSAEQRRMEARACALYLRRWVRALYMYTQHATFFVLSTFIVIQLLPERIDDYDDFVNLPYLLVILFGPMTLEFLFMGVAAVYVKWPKKEVPGYPNGRRADGRTNGGPDEGGDTVRNDDNRRDDLGEGEGIASEQPEERLQEAPQEPLFLSAHTLVFEDDENDFRQPRAGGTGHGQHDVTVFHLEVMLDGEPTTKEKDGSLDSSERESFDLYREESLEGDSEDSDGDINGVIITVGDIKSGRTRMSQKELRRTQTSEPLEFIIDLDDSSQEHYSGNSALAQEKRVSSEESLEEKEDDSISSASSETVGLVPSESRAKRTASMATAAKSPEMEELAKPKMDQAKEPLRAVDMDHKEEKEEEEEELESTESSPENQPRSTPTTQSRTPEKRNVQRPSAALSRDSSTAERQKWNDRLYTLERAISGEEKERQVLEELVEMPLQWHKLMNQRLSTLEVWIYDEAKDRKIELRFEALERSVFGSNPTQRAVINQVKHSSWNYGRGEADAELVDNVCLVITCHESCFTESETKAFEETLRHALQLFPPEAIFVCDNANSPYPVDNTEAVCKAVCREFYEDYDVNYLYIPEGNKTHAQYWASDIWIPLLVRNGFVPNFEFCMIVDDDVPLPADLAIQEAVDTMTEKPYIHAMGFAITAEAMDGKTNRLIDCQDFEYRFTGLAKLVMDRYGSVNFCHGAVGLWRRSVLGEKVLYHHNTEFYGDDMYMGHLLHEMGNNYKISFRGNTLVPTYAPPDLLTLYCQRVQSWDKAIHRKFTYLIRWFLCRWCGGWRKLVLKFFILYDILLEVRDFQIIFLVFGTLHRDPGAFLWIIFQLVYLPVLLAVFSWIVLQDRPELRPKPYTILLYMFYKGFLLFLRLMALLEDIVRYAPWGRQHRRIGERVEQDRDLPPPPRPKSVDWNTVWQRKKTLKARPSLRSMFS